MSLLERFHGKKVLVTGHTGFKGTWLSLWLKELGAEVFGISIDVPTDPSHYNLPKVSEEIQDYWIDIRDLRAVREALREIEPDFVFHLAAQALVRRSYDDPVTTIGTNAVGSVNVLEAVRALDRPITVVMITSDKSYDNVEWVWGYRETDRLGGKDPYSASKGMAELAIRAYINSYFKETESRVRVGVARAGNVIGGGDWAQDRIIPDCVRAWSKSETAEIRNPNSTRPWQHVLEPLSGYLTLGAMLMEDYSLHGQAYNFGPSVNQDHSVRALVVEMGKHWDNVLWKDVSESRQNLHEAGLLKLNCDKALIDLNWMSTLQFPETIGMTARWYRAFYESDSDSICEMSKMQISEYEQLAKQKGISWAQ